jgi:hypothetical protein
VQLKYTGSIEEKHLTRKRKTDKKKIRKTRNMKTIIGICPLVKGFEEEGL